MDRVQKGPTGQYKGPLSLSLKMPKSTKGPNKERKWIEKQQDPNYLQIKPPRTDSNFQK